MPKREAARARLLPLLGRLGFHRRPLRGERGLLLLELARRFLRRRLPGRAFDSNCEDRCVTAWTVATYNEIST